MFLLCIVVVVVISAIIIKICTVLTNFQCVSNKCLLGKVAIVTGGTYGIGLETVRNLASRGCKVIVANNLNSEKIIEQIREHTQNSNIFWKHIELGSLESVRAFAADILKTENQLDILINNAGTAGFTGYTKDGLQKAMQINYFGHFLLIHLLIELLKKSKNARIINLSSILAFTHVLNKPELINLEVNFPITMLKTIMQYSNSKLCILISTKVMADKLRKHNILCNSLHPGLIDTAIYKTGIERSNTFKPLVMMYKTGIKIILHLFGKNIIEGMQTTLHCALSDDILNLSGKYFMNGKVFAEPTVAKDKDFCMKIWKESERLVKLTEEEKLK